MQFNRRSIWISGILFFLSLTLFLVNIQFPSGPNFDEFHYIPSSKQFLEMKRNQNTEHPPLGKLIIAGGIAAFGDQPLGWRFMSAVFGSITLVGMFFLGLALFQTENNREKIALWIVLITLVNQLLYVQSRIAMLDTFMFAFLVWALVAFCAAWKPGAPQGQVRRLFLACGIFLGLATACKWFAMIPWISCLLLVGLIRLLQFWKIRFEKSANSEKSPNEDWYSPELWQGLTALDWLIYLGLIPVLVYSATFLPFLAIPDEGLSVANFFERQRKMWDGQMHVISNHPYMSRWPDWPLLWRPIWYAFDREGPNQYWVRGVLLLGNPLVMWGGFVALLICVRDAVLERSRPAFLIAYFYSVFYLSWIFIPRRIAFYYYYYPAGMMLSFALAYFFFNRLEKTPEGTNPSGNPAGNFIWGKWAFLAVSLALFVYFFPILAALKIPADSFREWMWFRSWI